MLADRGPVAVARYARTPAALLIFAKGFLARLTDNPSLPSPVPSIDAFEADLEAFDLAQLDAKDRSPVAVAERDRWAVRVQRHVGRLVAFVQEAADMEGTPAAATVIIVGAGLSVRKTGKHTKPEIAAKYTGIPGELRVVARAVPGAGAYYWEWSVDGITWTTLPDSRSGSTMIGGLTPGRRYFFRFRALTRKGTTGYSQVASIIAL